MQNRWIGSTQLAEIYARHAFPCFDEPAFKAVFRLTLDHKPDYHAISNMPLKSVNTLQDGWKSSTFEDSVPMSTYLMAWTVFDFLPINKTTGDGVNVSGLITQMSKGGGSLWPNLSFSHILLLSRAIFPPIVFVIVTLVVALLLIEKK